MQTDTKCERKRNAKRTQTQRKRNANVVCVQRKRNGNFSLTATVCKVCKVNHIWLPDLLCSVTLLCSASRLPVGLLLCEIQLTWHFYTRQKVAIKLDFKLGMELKKYRNKAEMKERKKTTLHLQKIHTRYRVVFLRSFISALFLYFFQLHPYLKSSFTESFIPIFYSFSGGGGGVSKPTSN